MILVGVEQASLGLLTYGQLQVLFPLPGLRHRLSEYVNMSPPLHWHSEYVVYVVSVVYVSRQYQIVEILMPLFCTWHHLSHDMGRRHARGCALMGSLCLFLFILRN